MKCLLKIITIIIFSIFGFFYNIFGPGIYEIFIPCNIHHYSYIDAGDDRIWPNFFLGGLFFIILWGWIGVEIFKNPITGLLRSLGVVLGTLIFFVITYKFWPVINSAIPQTAFVNALYTLSWCLISWCSMMIITKLFSPKLRRIKYSQSG